MASLANVLKWLLLLPVLVAAALLAVANDQEVALRLNPFDPSDAVLAVRLALYQVAFLFFLLGALAGGLVVWNGQRKHRRQARQRGTEAALWRARAERQERRPADAALISPPRG